MNNDFSDLVFKKDVWWQKPIYWLGIGLSVLWICIALDYFYKVGWWTYRYKLAPAELVGIVLSQIFPIALVWFVIAWIERKNQLKQETKVLRTYMSQLMYPTEEGAVYTKTLTDSLRSQIQEFKKVFTEVAEQTGTVKKDLKLWIDDLAGVVSHADTHTVATTKELAKHITVISKATEKTNETTKEITFYLKERAKTLENTSTKIHQLMTELTEVLKANKEQIEKISTALSSATDKNQNSLTRAEKVTQTLGEHTEKIEYLFKNYESQTAQSNKTLIDNAEQILTALKKQGSQLEEDVEKTLFKISKAEEKSAEQTQALFQLSDSAIHHLNDLSSELAIQAEALNQTLSDTQKHIEDIKEVGITSQLNEILDVSQKAKTYVEQTKAELADIETDKFMKDAKVILEALSTFSVDIAHIFTPKTEEEMWKKYYAGDKNIFTRAVIPVLEKEKKTQIKKMFEENPEVRSAISRYMASFEELIEKAQRNEHKDILLPVLMGSDAGRLSMILTACLAPRKKGEKE